MRIGIDLSQAPQMLRAILENTISEIEGAEMADLSEGGRFDVFLICSDDLDPAWFRSCTTDRIVAVSRQGDKLRIAEKGHAVRTLDCASHDTVRDALTGELEASRPGLLLRIWRWLRSPVAGSEVRSREPRVVRHLAPLNAWLAARVLAHRAEGMPLAGEEAFLAVLEQRSSAPEPRLPGLDHVVNMFGLGQAERDLILAAALVEVSPEAARLVGLLNGQDRIQRLTLANLADLGHDPALAITAFRKDRPLFGFGLLEAVGDGPLISRTLRMPADVVGAILGMPWAGTPELVLLKSDTPAVPQKSSEAFASLSLSVAGDGGKEAVVVISGPSDSGRRDLARALAATARSSAIEADTRKTDTPSDWVAVRRGTMLNDAVLILSIEGELPDWKEAIRGLKVPIIVLSPPESFASIATRLGRPAVPFEIPERDTRQRAELWRQVAPALPQETLDLVAARFDYGRRGVDRALRLATTEARLAGQSVPTKDDILAACDHLRTADFQGAAERLTCPYRREDIVLKPETEAEIELAISWARYGSALFGEDGPGRRLRAGQGLACLFAGPPGTGKTMAAQIVAREVNYALYRIDLSQIFDKYIGESEKRLAALFDEAERSRVALFFDEADSCFGKRTEIRDSHDRYANMGTNFLLQRLESFEGLAMLATNFAANIDDAFLRRLRVRADFAVPGPTERRRIWERLLPAEGERADDIDIEFLAEPFEIVGGEIRNAVYTGHLLAASEGEQLAMRHCVRGLWRELVKIGRLTDRSKFGPWQENLEDMSKRRR